MKKITVFDTSVASDNMGDNIIMEAINQELLSLFPTAMFFTTQTHDIIFRPSYKIAREATYSFVGGTNLFTPSMNIRGYRNQWSIGLVDDYFLKNIIFMGVGCSCHTDESSRVAKRIYKKVLAGTLLHSVRDNYTKTKLNEMGFDNVLNTGCPTMWGLNKNHCAAIPTQKANNVVFTLTVYDKNYEQDQKLIDILRQNYNKIYFWPQSSHDYSYFKTLNNTDGINVLGGNLWSYDALLEDETVDLDYIGSRLHGGIRAIQKKRRAIIIGIDNRAAEKAKDFNLTVLARKDTDQLTDMLNGELVTDIKLNTDAINRWRNQFSPSTQA